MFDIIICIVKNKNALKTILERIGIKSKLEMNLEFKLERINNGKKTI